MLSKHADSLVGDYITFGAFFFLPQHNGKTQSCPEAKASSAAKNHTPDDGKYTISLYLLVFKTIGCCGILRINAPGRGFTTH